MTVTEPGLRVKHRSPLRSRAFRLLAVGQFTSTAGDQLYLVALPVLILARPDGTRGLSVLLAVFGLCRACTLPVGGWLADRIGPRRVMLSADLLRAAALCTFTTIAWQPGTPLWTMSAAAGTLGLGEGCFNPAALSVLPRLLPESALQSANAVYQGGMQVIGIGAPALGGLAVAALRPQSALLVDAGSFLVSAATLLLMGRGQTTIHEPASQPAGEENRAARPTLFSLLRTDAVLRTFLLAALAVSLVVGGVLEIALPVLAEGPLRGGSTGYGLLLAGFSASSLAGAVLAGRATRVTGTTAALSLSLLGAALVAMAAVATLPRDLALGTTLALTVIAGTGPTYGNILLLTLFQRHLPPAALGRVMGAMLTANFGLFPVATLIAGAGIDSFGVRTYLTVAGFFVFCGTFSTLASITFASSR